MEPAAPGTEDDPVCTQEYQESKPTKKDAIEEQALSKKAFLPNGTYGNIFLLEYVQGAPHWFCRVCERPVFGQVFNHELGKRHVARLKLGKNDDDHSDNEGNEKSAKGPGIEVVVAPGEPLPPGFEGEVEASQTIIQDRLDKFNAGPLVGLEYLLELIDYDPSKEPAYMCILCHKKGDPRTILTHLASYNHQLTYLQKHFPTAYRHIAPYMIKGYKRNWQNGLLKIVEAIEATFGRLKPIQVENAKYSKDQMYYVELVAKAKHFSELSGRTFENVVTKEELTRVHEIPKGIVTTTAVISKPMKRKSPSPPVVAKPVKKTKPPADNKSKRRSLSPVSDVSSSDLEDFDVKSPKKSNKYNERESYRRPPPERSPYTKREGNMPWQKSSYRKDRPQPVIERSRDERLEKIEEYKRLAKAIDNQMEIVLKKHTENPEKHPKYNDEWKKFWNARYKELQAEGKNAATHDFKPEWIECWNKRMLELHKEEIVSSKAALRKRLGLPEEPTPISFKIGERRKAQVATSNKPTPTAAQPDNDPEVIVIDDAEEDLSLKGRNRSRSPVKKREHSPQFRRRSPVRKHSSSPSRKNNSPSPPSYRRRDRSPPTRRRDSPLSRRKESLISSRRESPPSRKKDSPKRQLSPLSRRKGSPFYHKAPSPPTRLREDKLSPPRDRFERTRDRSEERSRSRGKSREISWERERERRRDYDEKHWDRPYRGREYPWEHELHSGFNANPYAPPKILRDVTRKPVLTPDPPSYQDIEPIEEDGDVNIVAVLRLLTALEEKLGSLGPKVIDLLSQALAMEKKVPNSSEELLESEMNCVLFETVKEKLKGQLQAGLVDWIQEKAFKTAIRKTASLIHVAGERKKQKEEEMPKKPVVVPGIGKVDKGKIARQIANALIAQGKTDVTQSELEELINAVVGIAEAQKNSSEPLTTASFLEKLSASQPKETKTIEPKVEPEPKVKPAPKEKEEKETVHKLEEDLEVSSSSQDKGTINMEGLSDSDLETLLQNFKDLSSDEQVGLINYLKKLEAREPERVEKLRKFVNLSESTDDKDNMGKYSPSAAKIEDSFTNKESAENKNDEIKEDEKEENNLELISIDSEDEYSFDDVAKAVSQKVIENEKEQKRLETKNLENKNLDDAKAFITSLMSSLNKTVSQSTTTTTTNPPVVSSVTTTHKEKINVISNIPVSSVDIANSLSGITMSMSSLGNILGNVQSLTNKAQAVQQQERQPELKLNIPIQPLKPSNIPLAPINSSRNPYNDFDIASQRDPKSKSVKIQLNKSYDEFNIGPIPQDVKDDVRAQGTSSSRLMDKPLGYSDLPSSSNSSFPERIPQSNTNLPFTNLQRNPIRGSAIQEKQLPLFPNNQFPAKGGPFPDKFLTGGNNFDLSGGNKGDLEPRITDFRGGASDVRGGVGNFRGSTDYRDGPSNYRDAPNSYRDVPNSYRDAPNSYRDAPNSYRDAPNSYRDAPNSYRDAPNSYRDAPNNYRDAPKDYRDDPNDYRGAADDYRDAMNDYGDSPNDYRDSPNDYRGAPSNYRGGPSNIRGNDFRDSRPSQGNIKSIVDDSRSNTNDYRGGFGNPRGGQTNKMGGNVNYGNRQNSFPPAPRYPPQGNNYNAYNKW